MPLQQVTSGYPCLISQPGSGAVPGSRGAKPSESEKACQAAGLPSLDRQPGNRNETT